MKHFEKTSTCDDWHTPEYLYWQSFVPKIALYYRISVNLNWLKHIYTFQNEPRRLTYSVTSVNKKKKKTVNFDSVIDQFSAIVKPEK